MNALTVAFVGFVIAAVTQAHWLRRVFRVAIPKNMLPHVLLMLAGAVLGMASFAMSDVGVLSSVLAVVAIFLGLFFGFTYVIGSHVGGAGKLQVGAEMPSFEAPDEDGQVVALQNFFGQPLLLKFFRGHWCPYCVAELRRWEELRPELEKRNIQVITVCGDTPEKIKAGRAKHGLQAVMLADPEATLIQELGIDNKRKLQLPLRTIPLPIPTTVLIDSEGRVRWLDQHDNYQNRSDPARVLAALNEHLPR